MLPDEADQARRMEELRRVLLRPDALVDKVAPIIADALEAKIRESRDEIAQALAPAIGEAIRRQVYQAREDIIDALYPIIGATINKAITEAVRNLARTIEARMRRGFRPQDVLRRWQARLRGVPEGEYRLREALPFAVREIFLIQRESGLLIRHLTSDPESPPDRDLVSGMLTAIRDFAREAFGRGEEGELGAIEYENQHILLEAGGAAYLAVVVDGVEPPGFREEMRQALVSLHEHHYDGLKSFDGTDEKLLRTAEKTLSPFFSRHAPARTSEGPPSPLQRAIIAFLLLLVLLPPILGCGWWIWHVERSLAALAAVPATATPTATFTPTPTATATATPTSTPTATPTSTPTATPTSTPTPTPSRFTGVMIGNVWLRDAPNGARTGLVAPLGAPVEILAQYDDWYRVRALVSAEPGAEVVGWVPAQWVTLLRPVPPELVTPTVSP